MSTATLPPVNPSALLARSDITKKQLKEVHDTIASQLNKSDVRNDIHLLEVFLPYVESKASAGKKEIKLNEYIAELEEFVKNGTSNANRFLRLREEVVAFQKKLHDIIPSQIADVKEQLKNLDVNITKLEGELKEFAKVLSFFGENTMEETMKKAEEKARKEDELKGLQKKKGDLNARRAHLEAALVELNALDATFADLIGRLTTMETIWRMLVNDAIKLKEGLVKVNKPTAPKGSADDDDEDEAAFVKLRMKSLKAVYFTLQDALDTYALSVAPA
ncbi:hypothetical protein GALMADRAFT_215120 [Galerina marginata CBS 339.88]|uniref:Uncharacterized protein n=1 Tax=Galerina marginata (strain CBS 339.88) TaxID=685588 RepID=A0A067SEY9_GALM3|nr:hypothetical protein GALMADRAFT_215120 [Galerina marginata CBS 339.88]